MKKPPKGWRLLKRGTLIRAADKIWMHNKEWQVWGSMKKCCPNERVDCGTFIRRITKRKKKV